MQKDFIQPTNVVDITMQIFFMDLNDIKPKYADLALIHTESLIEAWTNYQQVQREMFSSKKMTRENEKKLCNLMEAANTLVDIMKAKAKRKLEKQLH